MKRPQGWLVVAMTLLGVSRVGAVDIGVSAERLVLSANAVNGSSRLVFVSTDPALTKGAAGDPAGLSGRFEVFYTDRPGNDAIFELPSPWRTNSDYVAKYQNQQAPAGGGIKVGVVKPGKAARVVAKNLGDGELIDLASGAPGANGITVVLTIENANDSSTTRLCTNFPAASIDFKASQNGLRHKIIADNGQPSDCGTIVRMEPALPGGFFSMPWPNDTRVHLDGTIDIDTWPGRDTNAVLNVVLQRGSAATTAFGSNAAVYFQTSGLIDAPSLPSPEASVGDGSPLMLVNLDFPAQPRIPLLVDFRDAPTTFRPEKLLTLLPYPGYPLALTNRYAAIVFDGTIDDNGVPVRPSPLLAELDEPWDPGKPVDAVRWAALQAQRADIYDYVEQHTDWTADQVIGFTVFSTQDVLREMEAIYASVTALPAPTPVSRTTGSCPPAAERTTVFGELDLPKWQAGPYPFLASGGEIEIVAGMAVQQSVERVDFEMTFPCGPAPANGWPILLFMDGTGGSAESAFISELGFATLPYIVASIAPLYSGDRSVGPNPEIVFFNYLNPLAGRTNQLQQVGDMIYLRRIVEGVVLSATETGNLDPVETDDDIVVITGHSQGALTIPQTLAVDDNFDGGFISAGGAGFYHSIIHRADVRGLVDTLLGGQPGELDAFHPVVQILQTIAEIGDAANYAASIDTAHVVSVGGLKDGCSPLEVIAHLGTAMGLDVTNPLYHPVFGSPTLEPPTIALPVTANLPGGRTGVTIQLDTGHFGASTNPTIGRSFVESLASGGVPTLDPDPLLSSNVTGCSGRFDPLP